MDISLNQDQQLLYETALEFARSAMTPTRIRELEDSEQGFDTAVWKQMTAMGWAGAVFPEQYGGAGVGATELALVVEALGQGAIPSPLFSTVIEAGSAAARYRLGRAARQMAAADRGRRNHSDHGDPGKRRRAQA